MHIAHLARAENELLASALEDKLGFVCRLNQSQSVSAPRQSRRIREPSDRTLTALVSSPGRARFRSLTALRRSETIDTIANRGRTPQLGGFDRAGRGQRCRQDTAHDRLFGERTKHSSRGRSDIIEDGGRPCPGGNRRTHRQILAAAK
jgi:hypothetical protein